MSKISELGKITGGLTKSRDLFVTVSLDQGDDGTKNITRAELVNAIEQEVFDNIKIDGGDYIQNIPISEVTISQSTINESAINDSTINTSVIDQSDITDSEMDGSVITNSTMDSSIINSSTMNTSFVNDSIMTDSIIDTSTINDSTINDATINDGTINDAVVNNPNINVDEEFAPDISNTDYFYLKDVSLGRTVAISYEDLYKEISKTAKKANKVYVGVDGDDNNPGSYLKPVATLERAFELAEEAAAGGIPSGYPGDNSPGIPTAITVFPGDYYTNGNLALPDRCTMISTNGQYATRIIQNTGYERENVILLGSGCYVQGFSFFNNIVDNFDYPSKGFAFSFRPGARIIRSPYVRDCSQIANYFGREIPPLLNPFNSRGTIEDLGYEVEVSGVTGTWEVDDLVTANNGVTGYVSRVEEIGSGTIYIRNNSDDLVVGSLITSSSGGTAIIDAVLEEDYPNKEVGRGGGTVLADRALVDQDSIFPYILCFGVTPRTQNGLGYVAKNGAGINGISSLSIFSRCAFYALNGGQITLNNSGTQFGDISMRAKGSTPVQNPRLTTATLVENDTLADEILAGANTIIDDMWDYLTISQGYSANTVNEDLTRRDALNFIKSITNDFREGAQTGTRIFTAGLFNYEGRHVFSVFNPDTPGLRYLGSVATVGALPNGATVEIDDAYIVYTSVSNIYVGDVYYWDGSAWINDGPNDITLLNAFTDSFTHMGDYIKTNFVLTATEENMVDGLINDVLIASLRNPRILRFGSLVESLSHQFNLASAGVNVNALPLNFRRLGQPISAAASVLQQEGGRVRWSGADELNNQYFARGLKINGRTGRIEGRPFTSSVRKLARRASQSRAFI